MKAHCIFICILLTIVESSCKTEDDTNNRLEKFAILQIAKNNSMIYVIPSSGCTGCISDAEKLALEKVNNDSFYFVFTGIISIKLFKLKFPDLLNAKNVIVDSQNIYNYSAEKFGIYPIMYLKQNENFKLKKNFKPE